jgi:hypothetical protein
MGTESPGSEFFMPGEGSTEAVKKMLEDPAFLDACASPSEAELEVLEHVTAEARKLLNAFQTEECARRIEVGLYESLEGYKPGEPFATPTTKRNEIVSFSFDGSQARRVDFSVKEYPHLHTLRDNIDLLESELRLRGRTAVR